MKKISMERAVHQWTEWLDDTLSEGLSMAHATRLEAWLKRGNRRKRLTEAADWKAVNQFLKDKAGEGVKHGTIKQYTATFKSFFKYLFNEGYLDKNPGALIRLRPQLLSVEQQEVIEREPFTFDEYQLVLSYFLFEMNAAKKLKTREWARFWRCAVPLSYWCGLRLMDCACLEKGNIWHSAGGLVVWTKKANRRTMLPFSDPLIGHSDLINAIDYIRRDPHVMKCMEDMEQRDHCFPNMHTRIISSKRNQFSVRFKRALDGLGIKGKSFHCLRHSFATRLEAAGRTVEDIAVLIAHSNTKTTQGYIH